ncbi:MULTISPECIES: hypothetical protein [unclassified Leifsonia]|uniref:hypothetical protein n=1 Tax=unclassified Leifsonia TaxID=2663824 RepID=UPI0006FFEAE9|nr:MULTISPECIES: hypothetical protein [unclassified Leifsonia]KQX06965.1 hypothetical protein ASC59_03890 [Leifsonia sp. Root1293]KRA11249.1 hypothetical protein ASD61_03890 [Leifsonia sp. Root60]
MRSEDDLRRQLLDDATRSTYTDAAHTIDVSQVIRRTRGRRRTRMLLASSGTALALAGIAVTAAFGVPALTEQSTTPPPFAETTTPTPEPSPTPTPTPTSTPSVAAVEIPSDCSGIYTTDWTSDFNGLVLNPERPGDDSQKYAALDDVFGPTLEANSKLGCLWASADPGADEVGLRTEVASLTPELQDSLIEHAKASGYTCTNELGGTRCNIQSEAEVAPDEARSGTTHFFRDGIWVSTWWLRINPPGYTEDIEKALFGAATEPPASAVEIPTDCSGIYTKDWTPEMGGLALNPAWLDGLEDRGPADEPIAYLLYENMRLSCSWTNPDGPRDSRLRDDLAGVGTVIAALTPEQTDTALALLNQSGPSCVDEIGGVRCDSEVEDCAVLADDGGCAADQDYMHGESHIIRDGIWIASTWSVVHPDGYTDDIEAAIFGASEPPEATEE